MDRRDAWAHSEEGPAGVPPPVVETTARRLARVPEWYGGVTQEAVPGESGPSASLAGTAPTGSPSLPGSGTS